MKLYMFPTGDCVVSVPFHKGGSVLDSRMAEELELCSGYGASCLFVGFDG